MPNDSSPAERTSDAGLKPGATDFEKHLGLMESFLHELIKHGPFKLSFSIHKAVAQTADPDAPEYVVELSGPDSDLLLERHAALLEAIEYVALKASRLDEDRCRKIAFDCQNWRQSRIEELRLMAQVAADRVIESGAPFTLSPMNPRERRIVHLALKGRPEILTQSEGMGLERKVIIYPAK
jgi:spoIIIJ-associated protein